MSRPRSSYTLWIVGKVIRLLFAILVFSVPTILLWRMFVSQNLPRELRDISDNAVLSEAYEAFEKALYAMTNGKLVPEKKGTRLDA